jgi:hypothetical protein
MKKMNHDRRKKGRTLCAELLMLSWLDDDGTSRKDWASLEDISATGACLHLENSIPTDTHVTIYYPKGKYEGKVKYCKPQQIGYLLGIAFARGYLWSTVTFRPTHVLDMRRSFPKKVAPALRLVKTSRRLFEDSLEENPPSKN